MPRCPKRSVSCVCFFDGATCGREDDDDDDDDDDTMMKMMMMMMMKIVVGQLKVAVGSGVLQFYGELFAHAFGKIKPKNCFTNQPAAS